MRLIFMLLFLSSCGYSDIDSVPTFNELKITNEESIDLCKLSNTDIIDLVKCFNKLTLNEE